jgi:hypothetical protein
MARGRKKRYFYVKQDAHTFLPGPLLPFADHLNYLQDNLIRAVALDRNDILSGHVLLPRKRRYMTAKIGRRAADALIPYMQSQPELFDHDPTWIVGSRSKSYGFGPHLVEQPVVRIECRDDRLLAKMQADDRAKRKHFGSVHTWLCDNLEKLTMDAAEALSAAAESEHPEPNGQAVKMFLDGEHNPSLCEYGRYHSTLTRLLRAARKSIHHNGQPLTTIDIANSQPLVLGVVVRDSVESSQIPADLRHYLDLCEQGCLYGFFMDGIGWREGKQRFKDAVWFEHLYGPNSTSTALSELFNRHFPTIARFVASAKAPTAREQRQISKDGTAKHVRPWAKLPRAMQRAESGLVIGGVCRRL